MLSIDEHLEFVTPFRHARDEGRIGARMMLARREGARRLAATTLSRRQIEIGTVGVNADGWSFQGHGRILFCAALREPKVFSGNKKTTRNRLVGMASFAIAPRTSLRALAVKAASCNQIALADHFSADSVVETIFIASR